MEESTMSNIEIIEDSDQQTVEVDITFRNMFYS